MMKEKFVPYFLVCCIAVGADAAIDPQIGCPLAKVTLRVVDETGTAIVGADVRVWFSEQFSTRQAMITGETDAKGEFTSQGYSDRRLVSDASKTGFYNSGSSGTIFNDQENGRWVPWNAVTEILMRPIGLPVPLYVKTGWFDLPVVGEPCGYDLMIGDWTAPFGAGKIADLVFTLKRQYVSRDDFEVRAELHFSQPHDGIQEVILPALGRNSVFKWGREAPETGYRPTLMTRLARRPGSIFEVTASEAQAYFFRVRTVEENGRIVGGFYGKISGGLQLAPSNSRTSKVKITYYLNPISLDRNLEWDTKRNLLSGLTANETPHEP